MSVATHFCASVLLVVGVGCGGEVVGSGVDPGKALDGRPDPEVLVELGGPSGPTPGDSPDALAVDRTHVYFSTMRNRIGRVAKNGGPVEFVAQLQAESGWIDDVAVDDDAVYWSEVANISLEEQTYSVWRQPKGSTTPSLLFVQLYGDGLSVDAERVYWLREDKVMRMSRQGGEEETVVALPGSYMRAVHASSTSLLFATNDAVYRVTDRTLVTIATGQMVPYPLLSDSERAYWINAGAPNGEPRTPGVLASALDGGEVLQVAGCESSHGPYAVDADGVYCVLDETLEWAVPNVGAHEPIWMQGSLFGPSPWDLATDESAVYWSSLSYGILVRCAK